MESCQRLPRDRQLCVNNFLVHIQYSRFEYAKLNLWWGKRRVDDFKCREQIRERYYIITVQPKANSEFDGLRVRIIIITIIVQTRKPPSRRMLCPKDITYICTYIYYTYLIRKGNIMVRACVDQKSAHHHPRQHVSADF